MRRGIAFAAVWTVMSLAIACGDGGSGQTVGTFDDGYPPNPYDQPGGSTEAPYNSSESAGDGIDDGVPSNQGDPLPGPGPESDLATFCSVYCQKVGTLPCAEEFSGENCVPRCLGLAEEESFSECRAETIALVRACTFVCEDNHLTNVLESCPSEATAFVACLDDEPVNTDPPPNTGGSGGGTGADCTPGGSCQGCTNACDSCLCNTEDPSACVDSCS